MMSTSNAQNTYAFISCLAWCARVIGMLQGMAGLTVGDAGADASVPAADDLPHDSDWEAIDICK
jgi:hypothetical protein